MNITNTVNWDTTEAKEKRIKQGKKGGVGMAAPYRV